MPKNFSFSLVFTNYWFYCSVILVLLCVILYILLKNRAYRNQFDSKFSAQNEFIKLERQRISGEIHDEVGSGLSAIKLYAELSAKNKPDIEEVRQLSDMINDISEKINEVIWSTNSDNDSLINIIYYIEEQIRKFFEHSGIRFEGSLPNEIPEITIKSQSRRELYLLAKEIAHNAIKHSQASEVKLNIAISNGIILLNIKDNGVGFDPSAKKVKGMGLANIKLRTQKLKGTLKIENYKGTSILVRIPIDRNVS
ncbi:sensor histidine kinase [Pedobacter endophyticus]|uniref:histidine kinase n=1 Tax=Pedobacter endophyticus TaxID=2789740 RepID=A0A7U3SPD6_9SPHI|nr:ATP-binding protein [Pedobacter endophyticus]QPH38363.1 hypothetical protein IZT61_14845 [Pedobacter endophyticus]